MFHSDLSTVSMEETTSAAMAMKEDSLTHRTGITLLIVSMLVPRKEKAKTTVLSSVTTGVKKRAISWRIVQKSTTSCGAFRP